MTLIPVSKFTLSNIKTAEPTVVATTVKPSIAATNVIVQPNIVVATPPPVASKHTALDIATATKIFTPILIKLVNPPIPLAYTKNGNLFKDKFDDNLIWYLPTFSLLPTTDSNFSFVATQSDLLDSEGRPSYVSNLKFTICKQIPADALAAKAANSSINSQEISLDALQVTLLLDYADDDGNEVQKNYPGTIQAISDGNFEVQIDSVKGKQVANLYQNLKVAGKVQIALYATYLAWQQASTRMVFFTKSSLFLKN